MSPATLVVMLLTGCATSSSSKTTEVTPQTTPEIPQAVARANNDFAVDFYRQIAGNDENIFFSPIGMWVAFSLLYEGAKGDTASQIQEVFGLETDPARRHRAVTRLLDATQHASGDAGDTTFDMANALWLADWFAAYDEYTKTVRDVYRSDVTRVNFSAAVAEQINRWAEQKTRGLIKQVASPDSFTGDTSAVITNAVYFKGMWRKPFLPEETRKSDFWTDPSTSVNTDFMHQTDWFGYKQVDGVQILKMQYQQQGISRFSMLVALPAAGKLAEMEAALSAQTIEAWDSLLSPPYEKLEVSLPKFTMKTKYDLKPVLENLGMTTAFDVGRADFSGVGSAGVADKNLSIAQASQKALLIVNEEGTEAAAVTNLGIQLTSASEPPPTFTADHPFLFIIRHNHSGAILFMGRLSNPAAATE